jgi:tetratricopeptide (TPR) repeat protein
MRNRVRAIAFTILALVISTQTTIGQEQQEQPFPDQQEEHAYSPPSPSKSVEIGNFYLRKKDLRGALSRFKEAVKTDPHYPPAYLGLGKVYEKMGLKQKALDAYQRYLDELPSEKDALEAKEVQKAIARLRKQLGSGARASQATPPP